MNTENEVNLDPTDPEAAALDAIAAEEKAAQDAAEAAKAAAQPDPEPEPTPEPAKPDPVLAAVAENTAATRALAEQLAASRTSTTETVDETPAARDFDAEIAAAEAKFTQAEADYDSGDLDKSEFDKAKAEFRATERAILRDQAKAEAEAAAQRVAEQQAADRAKQTEAQAEADWKAAQGRFFADPGNAALVADEIKKAAFTAAVGVVYRETPGLSYDDVLVKARERVTGVPSIDPNKATREATFERQKQANANAPTTLRDVPNSGNADSAPGASLDNLPISELEDRLMRMSADDRARFRAGSPGGLHDNPRA